VDLIDAGREMFMSFLQWPRPEALEVFKAWKNQADKIGC